MQTTNELIKLLQLQKIASNTYRGENNFMGSLNIFGGQFVAQALFAAQETVPTHKKCNSLHAYFQLPGNLKIPVDYTVQELRNGGSFTTRLVTAAQEGQPLFTMIASFHRHENGFSHQIRMPNVPAPETLTHWMDVPNIEDPQKLAIIKRFIFAERPLEMRTCPTNTASEEGNKHNQIWFRFKEVPESLNAILIQQLMAYFSDYNVLATALRPHYPTFNYANTQVASLDHAMWFHQDADLNDWLLYDLVSPIAMDGRGLATGRIFDRRGKLIASVAQEGLLRSIKIENQKK